MRRTDRPRGALALAAGALLTLTACGSTVSATRAPQGGGVDQQTSGLGGSGSSEEAPAGEGINTTDAGSGSTAGGPGPGGGVVGVAGPGGSAGGGSVGSATGGSASTPGTGGSAVRLGQGVSATEILVGRTRGTNSEAANKAFGNAVSPAPEDQYDKAMVDYINAHGGAAGRKIKLNYYTVDYTANKSSEQIQSEECAQWTQDNHVFAVLTGGQDQLRGCLAKKGVPQVYENVFSNSDNQTFSTFRSYYEINAISLAHLGTALPAQLEQGGYLKPGAKYGLLAFDASAVQRAVSQQLEPVLSRYGVKLDKKAYVKTPQTADEQGDALASLPGFVLAFKNAGVDRIIIFGDSGGALLAYFSRNAASQGYHPTYGITSASGPQALIDTGNIDPNELKGAVTGGWNPTGDVGVKPYTRYGAGYKLCASIMAKAGVPFEGSSNNTVVGSKTCDAFFFFAAAVNRGAPNVNRDSFLAGAESLGNSYVSALTYAASITTTARDGVSALATSVYDGSCTCFTYKSDVRRIR